MRDDLLKDFTGIVTNHVLIVFNYNFSRVTSARAILITPEFGIAYSEDWSRYLDKQYIIGKTSLINELNYDEHNEPLVKLKETTTFEDLVSIPTLPDVSNK